MKLFLCFSVMLHVAFTLKILGIKFEAKITLTSGWFNTNLFFVACGTLRLTQPNLIDLKLRFHSYISALIYDEWM